MSVHCQLAEYFEGIWFERVKPLSLYKVKKGEYPNADRGIRPQMIKHMHMYNERKLSELPYHLIKSHQFEKFRNLCGTNFEFLQGIVCAFSVFEAIMMLKLALQTMDFAGEIDSPQLYQDLDNVHKILLLSSENISRDRNNLAVEIISHFGPNYSGSESLGSLVRAAMSSLRDSETPALIPLTRIAPGPDSVLKFSITAEVFSRNSDDWNRQYKHVLCVDETKSVVRCIYTIGAQRYLYTISLENYGIVKSRHDVHLQAESVLMAGGDRFIVLENSESVELYEVSSWKKIPLKYSPLDCVAVSHSGRVLAYSAVLFAKVVVCQIGDPDSEPKELFRLDLENVISLMISYDDQILVVFDSEEKLTTYDIATAKALYTKEIKKDESQFRPKQHHSVVKEKLGRCVKLTRNNTLIRLDPSTVTVCSSDLRTGEHLHTLRASESGSGDLIALHASEKLVATVDRNKWGYLNVWRVWNLQTGELVSSPDNVMEPQISGDFKTSIVSMLLFGSETLFLATIERQNCSAVKISYLGTETSPLPEATPYCNLIGHNGTILEMCLAYGDSSLVTVANDNTIKVWDFHRLAVQFQEKFGNNPDLERVRCHFKDQLLTESKTTIFDISRNNKKAFIATDIGQLIIHDIENNIIEYSQNLKDKPVEFLLVSSSGQLVVMATLKGNITVLSADDNEVKHRFKHSQEIVNCMAEKNNILVVGTSGMAAKGSVWDITSGTLLKEFDLLYSLSVVALTSAGDKIVTSLFEYPLVLSITTDNNSMDMTQVDTAMTAASCVAIDNSDSLALIGSTDGQIRVIDLDGKYKFRLGQISSVMTAVFTPNGKRVVSAGYKNIFVWDLDQERLLYRVKKHTNFISKILFDETGKIMVTASWDKNIAVWDVPSGMSIATYYGHYKLNEVKITCDGGKVIFIPDVVNHIGILEPNKMLQHMMKGDRTVVRDSMLKAQALSFSGQKITQLTSQACTIL